MKRNIKKRKIMTRTNMDKITCEQEGYEKVQI